MSVGLCETLNDVSVSDRACRITIENSVRATELILSTPLANTTEVPWMFRHYCPSAYRIDHLSKR